MAKDQIAERAEADELRQFVRAVLEDVHALERMLAEDRIESGVRRVGAEQEMFLIDRAHRPANKVLPVLERLKNPQFTTELAQFNIEANLLPRELHGDCFARMEEELADYLGQVRRAAAAEQASVVLCGILPTLDKSHLGRDSMTPIPRYLQLDQKLTELAGGVFRTHIKGIDELATTHDNVMLEACNTSFQVHFQVGPREFARLYNLAQLITAPVLAAGVNSPVLLRHRLWHETRVALFQQSLDVRSETKVTRGARQRVSFGDRWVRASIMEIYREDVARFRALIALGSGESPHAVLDRGGVPELKSLRLHNGTVYRWNRPCYGVSGGVAHLRIENRVLPAGPTVVDEIANAAFFVGLMCGYGERGLDAARAMSFDDAKANFLAAARYGLQARLRWLDGKAHGADELILRELLPIAREGLEHAEVDRGDIERLLGVLAERVRKNRTGAQWALDSLSAMGDRGKPAEKGSALVSSMLRNQATGEPVHAWPLAELEPRSKERDAYRQIEQVMTTDLFTVHPEDPVDLAASLMDWEHIRYLPVEDQDGKLVGLVSHRGVLRALARAAHGEPAPAAIRELMKTELVTVTPETGTLDAIELMRSRRVACLPVVRDGRLVGIVTEHDFMDATAVLLDRWLQDP